MAFVLMIVLFSLGLFFSLIFVFHFRNIFLNTLPLPLCFYYVRIFLKILLRVLVFFTYFLLDPFLKVGCLCFGDGLGSGRGGLY